MARRGTPPATPLPSNGHGGIATTAPAPRIQRRDVWIDLGGQYAGFRLRVWINFRADVLYRLVAAMQAGDLASVADAFRMICLEHNGWLGQDDAVMPPPTETAFWDALPYNMWIQIGNAITAEAQRVPDFPPATRTT